MLPVTPQPQDWSGVCVSIAVQAACWILFRVVVVSGSPEDRTQRDPRIRRIWATSPRLPCCDSKSRTPRSRTESLPLPKRTCFHLHLYRMLFVAFAAVDSVGAYLLCQWAGRRSNPRLRCFKPPLDRLSYQPISLSLGTKKGPMSA